MENRDMPVNNEQFSTKYKTEADAQALALGFIPKTEKFNGLTKREHFAGLAMQGLLSTAKSTPSNKYATEAVNMADALLEALEKDNEL